MKNKVYVNDFFYYFTQEYNTEECKDCIMESHVKYVDIQWIIDGEEEFSIADIHNLNMLKEYSEEKDVIHWKPNELMARVLVRANNYIILLPQNAHMVTGVNGGSGRVKKIVGKVKIID